MRKTKLYSYTLLIMLIKRANLFFWLKVGKIKNFPNERSQNINIGLELIHNYTQKINGYTDKKFYIINVLEHM